LLFFLWRNSPPFLLARTQTVAKASVSPKRIASCFIVSSDTKIIVNRGQDLLKKRDRVMIRRKTDRPRGVLKTPGTSPRYRHERYHPSPDLDPYVEHYWVVEWDLRGQAPQRAETLPHPSVHMVFEQEGRSRP